MDELDEISLYWPNLEHIFTIWTNSENCGGEIIEISTMYGSTTTILALTATVVGPYNCKLTLKTGKLPHFLRTALLR